jgi:TonB family protein
MKTSSIRPLVTLLGYVSCLAAMPLAAQVGPIQPVMVLPDGKLEITHDRPSFDDDFSIPVDVYVAVNGSVSNVVVSNSSGNFNADAVAADFMRNRKFLPALNEGGQPVEGMAKVNVNMFKRGTKKVVRVTLKPPPVAAETDRVKRMMCADFVWEVNRMHEEAGIRDASLEVMPYMSAHMYALGKDMSTVVQEKFCAR